MTAPRSNVRQLIVTLLRLVLRRLETVEDGQAKQLELLKEIKAVVVQTHDGQRELHARLIEHADRSGERTTQLERRVKSLEVRTANGG